MDAEILRHHDPRRHVLKLHLFLEDFYAVPFLQFTIGNARKELTINKKIYKPVDCYDNGGFYHWNVPFDFDDPINFLRIEYTGYGGQGITYCTIESDRHILIPDKVKVAAGLVNSPHALLTYDQHIAFLGESDTLQTFLDPSLAKIPSVLHITLSDIPRAMQA